MDLPQSSYLLSPIVMDSARTTLFLQNFVLPYALFRRTYPVIRTSGGVSVTRMVLVLLAGSSAFTACRVSHQTLEGQPPLPMAKKSNYQNHCGQKRNRQPQLRHHLMNSPHGAAKFCVITASTVRWHGTLKSWLGSSSRYSVSVFISYLQSVHELNLLQIHALTRWP